MAQDEGLTANYRPYASPSNVTDVLKRIRSRNLPERIDNDYLRDAGVPDGSIARTMAALSFLGLVKDETPTEALRSIWTSTDEEYQQILADLMRGAYRDVFNVIDPAEDTQDRIVNVFRKYVPASQRGRMVVFFLAMCREAGIPTLDVPRQRSSGAAANVKAARPAGRGVTQRTSSPAKSGQLRSKAEDGVIGGKGLHPALELLVRSLPEAGKPLPEFKRRQWLSMAEATLTFMYPEQEEGNNLIEEVED